MQANKIDILLIEDSLPEADLIKEMLSEARQLEFAVLHVQHLSEGLRLLHERKFDVVLVDLGLPDSQGLETALTVRRQSKRTPVVALTVLDYEETALKSLQMDIQDYLIKGEINGRLLSRAIRYAIQRKRDSESLREIEDRFTSFMLHMPAAAWMKDLQGRYVYANAETERVFSTNVSQLLGRTDEEFLPPETAWLFAESDRRVSAEGGSLQTTENLRQADGIEHQFVVSKFAVSGPDGQPAYIAGVALDITETKRLEAEIERIASFPLMNPNPIVEVDASGQMTFCNPAAKQLLENAGYDRDMNPLIPHDMPEILKDLRNEKTDQFYREIEINGSFFEELVCLVPQLQTVRIYSMDMTRRKHAEEALKASEEMLRFASTAADIGLWHWDLASKELNWSRKCKELFGFPPDLPITYEAFLQSIHGEDRRQIDASVQKALREQSEYSVEMRVVLPGDQLHWVLSKGRAFYDDQGKPVHMDGIAMDVTEQKRAGEEIERLNTDLAARAVELEIANRDLEAFNYSAAHDLRQPLNQISSYTQAIKMLCADKLPEECFGYLEGTHNSSLRMNRLIEALLDLSRLGHVELRRDMVNLS